MKTFLLFLLITIIVTGAPYVLHASVKCELQHFLLSEIIVHVNGLKGKEYIKTAQILVDNVITPEHCTHENFCKAGTILSAYKAKQLGLKERDWLLPRQLKAYTENTQCKVNSSADQILFFQLLENIQLCAQQKYTKKCGQKEH